MWILALVALVGMAGLVRSLVMQDRPADEVAAQAVVVLVTGGLFIFFRRERRRGDDFSAWLRENTAAVSAGGARYRAMAVTLDTRVRSYTAVVSLLVVSLRLPTRARIVGAESGAHVALLCSLASLVLGWWGIPWGPVWTVQSLYRNAAGGTVTTVGELLAAAGGGVSSAASPPA